MPQRIIATGEFDNNEIVKGINGMVDALKRAQEQLAQLQKENNLTTESAKGAEEGIKRLTAQIAALDKTNKDYVATNSQLNGRLAALKEQYDKYNATIETQRKEITTLRGEVTKMTTAYDIARKTVTELQATAGKPIAPSLSDGKITATLTTVREKVKTAGNRISTTLTNSTAPGIDKVSDSISSLGEDFGAVGIAAGAALGFIAKKLYELYVAQDEAAQKQKILTQIYDEAAKSYGEQAGKIDLLKVKLNDLSIPLKDRVEVGKEYNKIADKANQLDLKQLNNLDAINPKIEEQIKLFKERALARAAENVIAEKAEKLFKDQLDFETKFPELNTKRIEGLQKNATDAINAAQSKLKIAGTINTKELLSFADLPDSELKELAAKNDRFKILLDSRTKNILSAVKSQLDAIDQYKQGTKAGGGGASILQNIINEDQKDLDKAIDIAAGLTTVDGLTTKDKITKARKQVQNIYEQELQKLRADIAKVTEKGFTDESTITAAVEADFKKRDLAFQKAFKNKQLTAGQLASLQENLKNLQQLVLDKSLKDFATQKAAYLKKISDELDSVQHDESLKRISTIQDNFERERQTIEEETKKTVSALEAKRDKTISDLLKDAAKNGLTEKDLQPQIDQIKSTYEKLLNDLQIIRDQKLQKLSFDTFEQLSEDAKRVLTAGNLGISQRSLVAIQDATAEYQAGKLSYAGYQKALTKIARDEANERFRIEKQFLESEIELRRAKLATDKNLTDDQVKKLQDEITTLQQRLADATKGNITTNTANGKSDGDKKIHELLAYANAIKSVTDSVISFWQQANEAEQRALDRSIALQDRRVEAARNVAAKGNAEYLRMEEEKQQQLLIKQENAARRQMAINAALQASQLLVAITGAIAKIAEPGVGTVDVIASIGVIVGALAGGYALVKSLQQNQPSFFVGTEDTGPGGNVDDKGGFHAVLHPHERVLTAEENKKLKGLSNKEVIERVERTRSERFELIKPLIENYRVKPAPVLNVAAMEMATNSVNSNDSRMAAAMEENNRELKLNNQLQLKTHRLLKGLGVNVKVDRNGVAVSVLEVIEEISKSKKI